MTIKTTKITTLLAVILIGATMSGCIEFHDTDIINIEPNTESLYLARDIPEYLKTHNISVNFGCEEITLHPDKNVTIGNKTSIWLLTGTGNDEWRCYIRNTNGIEYITLHDGRIATGYAGNITHNGVWFR